MKLTHQLPEDETTAMTTIEASTTTTTTQEVEDRLKNTEKVFVYGSLKNGLGLHRSLVEGKAFFLSRVWVHGFALRSLGGYPAMFKVHGCDDLRVLGEVYEISPDLLQRLDGIEGVPTLYQRTELNLAMYGKVWCYTQFAPQGTFDLVMDGNWLQAHPTTGLVEAEMRRDDRGFLRPKPRLRANTLPIGGSRPPFTQQQQHPNHAYSPPPRQFSGSDSGPSTAIARPPVVYVPPPPRPQLKPALSAVYGEVEVDDGVSSLPPTEKEETK